MINVNECRLIMMTFYFRTHLKNKLVALLQFNKIKISVFYLFIIMDMKFLYCYLVGT